jgi:23S rRNA G2445 N2-methylase RlmL
VRVGEERTLRDLYARFGQVVHSRFDGWSVAMYSSRRALAAHMGVDFRPLFATSNGGIRVSALSSDPGRILH